MLLTLLLDPNLGLVYRAVARSAAIGLLVWVALVWGGIWIVRQWRQRNRRKAIIGLLVWVICVVFGLNFLLAVPWLLTLMFT